MGAGIPLIAVILIWINSLASFAAPTGDQAAYINLLRRTGNTIATSSTPQLPYSVNQSHQFPDGYYACAQQYPLGSGGTGVDQCMDHCGDVVNQTISCIGLFYPSGPDKDKPILTSGGPGKSYQLGNCTCDVPMLDEVFYQVAVALPKVAAIGCSVLFGTFDAVLEYGTLAIPGVGEIDAGAQAALRATSQVSSKISDATQVGTTFTQWFQNPCGSGASKYTGDIDHIFGSLLDVASKRGLPVGKTGLSRNGPK